MAVIQTHIDVDVEWRQISFFRGKFQYCMTPGLRMPFKNSLVPRMTGINTVEPLIVDLADRGLGISHDSHVSRDWTV